MALVRSMHPVLINELDTVETVLINKTCIAMNAKSEKQTYAAQKTANPDSSHTKITPDWVNKNPIGQASGHWLNKQMLNLRLYPHLSFI